jgi:hypothetical protein
MRAGPTAPASSVDLLRQLASKYRTLAVLRARREELEGLGKLGFSDEEGEERRRAFKRVARAFPGALRELDACSAALLERKARAVEAAMASGDVPRWVEVVLDFHETLREALAVKLWLAVRLGRGGRLSPSIVGEFVQAHGRDVDAAFLERHLHPPGGRVLALVWEAVGARQGLTPDEIRAAVFGDPLPA